MTVTVFLRRGGLFVAALGLLVLAITAVTGCAAGSAGDAVLTVDQALAAKPGTHLRVQGYLLATGDKVWLSPALLESYPPQAGGSTLTVQGLDLNALVGLTSTAGQPDLAQATWSDHPVILGGVVEHGVLTVREAPPAVEASTAQAKVRFSPGAEPLLGGQAVWWVFEVANVGDTPLDLTFSSGQMGEVVLSQNGAEKYRWGAGKVFVENASVDTLEAGKSITFVLSDTLQVAAGRYDLTATVTATVGPERSTSAIPQIKTTITVR